MSSTFPNTISEIFGSIFQKQKGFYRQRNLIDLLTQEDELNAVKVEQNRSASFWLKRKKVRKKFRKQKPVPLLKKMQLQQFSKIALHDDAVVREPSEAEREINHYLMVSMVSMGLSIAGTISYPPLIFLSRFGLLYSTVPVWKEGIRTVREERRFGFYSLVSVGLSGLLLTGYHFAVAVSYVLFFLSEKLLLKTKDQSTESLLGVLGEQPRTVWVFINGVEVQTPFDTLNIGDLVVAHAGETIPVDGTITSGLAYVDQRFLTGEAQPAEKEIGDQVFASTVVLQGQIHIRVEKTGQDTIGAQISRILHQTMDYKSTTELRGQQLADKTALPIFALGLLAFPLLGPLGTLLILNASPGEGVRISAPISILNYLHIIARKGILIKDGRALELLTSIDTIVFDKTGTLTIEQPHIGAFHPCGIIDEDGLLRYAAAAEYKQSHPIAQAILQAAKARDLAVPKVDDTKYEIGYGLQVTLERELVSVGSKRFMELSEIPIPTEIYRRQEYCDEQGHSLVYVAVDGKLAGAIELHATIRPEAKQIIRYLRQQGLELYIISGDNEGPTKRLAHDLGIANYFAETLPENKSKLVEQLQAEGRMVCFVGDGINDSIALKRANVSISLSGASAIATDTASIILLDGDLTQLNEVFLLARQMDKNMRRNLIISIVPAAITIAGAFVFGLSILGAITLYNAGLVAGGVNAMLPIIRNQQSVEETESIKNMILNG